MKKQFLIILFVFLYKLVIAQNIRSLVYSAEGVEYVEIHDAIPSSLVSLYSEKGGGKRVVTLPVDISGKSRFINNKNLPLSFAINILNPNTSVVANNKVTHFRSKEFVFENVKIIRNHSSSFLQWEAAFTNTDDYFFEILGSVDGEKYNKVSVINTVTAPSYTYQYQANSDNKFYRVAVYGRKSGISYFSKVLMHSPHIQVYPTVVTNLVYVDGVLNAEYSLINTEGKNIRKGTFSANSNILQTDDLSVGVYFLIIKEENNETTTFKLFKE